RAAAGRFSRGNSVNKIEQLTAKRSPCVRTAASLSWPLPPLVAPQPRPGNRWFTVASFGCVFDLPMISSPARRQNGAELCLSPPEGVTDERCAGTRGNAQGRVRAEFRR